MITFIWIKYTCNIVPGHFQWLALLVTYVHYFSMYLTVIYLNTVILLFHMHNFIQITISFSKYVQA